MQTIVLITRENSERATHVSVFLFGSDSEAKHFCHFVNRLSLAGEDKLVVRRIIASAEYSLGKYQPFSFDDFLEIDNRTIQRVLRELDHEIKTIVLKTSKKEIKELFLRNMSKRMASMLEEDMDNMDPVTESDIENARQIFLDVYEDVSRENRFDEAWARYRNKKENKTKDQEDSGDKNHIVLVFCGDETVADCVSVYLFDKYENADGFCNYLNALEPDKGSFVYARHAEQMIEYETTKPLLISFDQIFEYSRIHGKFDGALIIREALKKFSSKTILEAVKGLNKRSRMLFMQSLPVKTADEVNEHIDYTDYSFLSDSRKAQQKIINAVNRTYSDYKNNRGKFKSTYILKA